MCLSSKKLQGGLEEFEQSSGESHCSYKDQKLSTIKVTATKDSALVPEAVMFHTITASRR